MYWTDVVLGRIRRSFLNGSSVTTVLSRRIGSPGQCGKQQDLLRDYRAKLLEDYRAKLLKDY